MRRGPDISESESARRTLLATNGDPFLFAAWENPLFLQYQIDPKIMRPLVPPPFELELYEGEAWLSLVAITMRRFIPNGNGWLGRIFKRLPGQQFLNLRTYVRHQEEPGAYFFHGWFSQPWPWKLPSGLFGFPYQFASCTYDHSPERGSLSGKVSSNPDALGFSYSGKFQSTAGFVGCAQGSLAEFTLERYAAFFCQGKCPRVFRAWHPPWEQTVVDIKIEQDTLVTGRFPWFKEAKLVCANCSRGFPRVWLGRAHRLDRPARPQHNRHGLGAFYEMP